MVEQEAMEKECYTEIRNSNYSPDQVPTLSVVMIAYNVGNYIAEAIESVLSQVTNFKVELVIGEDCSKDDTRAIAISYENKYPHIVRVLKHEKNLGLTPNCVATHDTCRGKYIALLDSDDYWTNINKLQRQVDFLEKNHNYSGCAHQSMKIYDDGSMKDIPFGEKVDKDYDVLDTITHRKFHTSALVYKREIWEKTGGIPKNISSNERAIYPMIAIFGKIKYFKESMCVYRFSGFGLSSRIDCKELETDLNMLPWLKRIDSQFPIHRFKSFIHFCAYTYSTKKVPFVKLLKNYILFTWFSFSYFPKNLGDLKWGTICFFQIFRDKLLTKGE